MKRSELEVGKDYATSSPQYRFAKRASDLTRIRIVATVPSIITSVRDANGQRVYDVDGKVSRAVETLTSEVQIKGNRSIIAHRVYGDGSVNNHLIEIPLNQILGDWDSVYAEHLAKDEERKQQYADANRERIRSEAYKKEFIEPIYKKIEQSILALTGTSLNASIAFEGIKEDGLLVISYALAEAIEK